MAERYNHSTMGQEVSPCPFCGGEAKCGNDYDGSVTMPLRWRVYCSVAAYYKKCDYLGPHRESAAEAIAAHNSIAAELAWRDARIAELETWRHLADELLQKLWRSFRNDASRVQGATECLGVFSLAGAIAHETAELWARRFRECPGHDDEGGRSWCAYCGDMPQATSPFDPDADGDKQEVRRG